jgi:hypothetical protein
MYEQENMHLETYFIKLIREYKQKGTWWVVAMVIETRLEAC